MTQQANDNGAGADNARRHVSPRVRGAHGTRGFTLVELIVTVVVIGIVLSIAIPNFTRLVRDNRLVSTANELVVGVQVARSEAVKRGQQAVICARDGTNQTCGSNWSNGWLVFFDADTDGAIDSGELVRQSEAINSRLGLTETSGGSAVIFDALGFATTTGTFDLEPSTCNTGDPRMRVTVSASGQTDTVEQQC